MNEKIIKTSNILSRKQNKEFIQVYTNGKFDIAIQKINGDHNFHHKNEMSDEVIIILKGKLKIWTEEGDLIGNSGDILNIKKGIEHGNINGENAEIIILENNQSEVGNG